MIWTLARASCLRPWVVRWRRNLAGTQVRTELLLLQASLARRRRHANEECDFIDFSKSALSAGGDAACSHDDCSLRVSPGSNSIHSSAYRRARALRRIARHLSPSRWLAVLLLQQNSFRQQLVPRQLLLFYLLSYFCLLIFASSHRACAHRLPALSLLCAADEAASGTGAAEAGVFAAVVRSAAAAKADLSRRRPYRHSRRRRPHRHRGTVHQASPLSSCLTCRAVSRRSAFCLSLSLPHRHRARRHSRSFSGWLPPP